MCLWFDLPICSTLERFWTSHVDNNFLSSLIMLYESSRHINIWCFNKWCHKRLYFVIITSETIVYYHPITKFVLTDRIIVSGSYILQGNILCLTKLFSTNGRMWFNISIDQRKLIKKKYMINLLNIERLYIIQIYEFVVQLAPNVCACVSYLVNCLVYTTMPSQESRLLSIMSNNTFYILT